MKKRLIVGLAVVAMLVTVACSKDNATPAASPASQGSTAPAMEAPATGATAYTATEYSFDGPDTLPAGTSDISVENVGTVDHEMTIVRLDKHQDWTEEQIVAFIKNDPTAQPKWAPAVAATYTATGPPVIAPGGTAPVVFMDFASGKPTIDENGSLQPGTYLFLCFQGDSKQPHAAMGMVKKVTVT